jgi:hypothetical protein
MPDALIVVIFAIFKEIVRLEDTELKILGIFTLENMILIKHKQD